MFLKSNSSGFFICKKCGHTHYVKESNVSKLIPWFPTPVCCPKCGSIKQKKDKKVLF